MLNPGLRATVDRTLVSLLLGSTDNPECASPQGVVYTRLLFEVLSLCRSLFLSFSLSLFLSFSLSLFLSFSLSLFLSFPLSLVLSLSFSLFFSPSLSSIYVFFSYVLLFFAFFLALLRFR